MTTWASSYHHNHLTHPWFASPSMKRKLTSPSGSSGSPCSRRSSESVSPPPCKRRKQTALEANFSNLSLRNPEPYASFRGHSAPYSSTHADAGDISITVDEDVPPIPDIKMKSLTWYEPEPDRIVITDLDSSSDEETEEGSQDRVVQISPAFLSRISAHSQGRFLANSTPSQALVLYKPLSTAGASSPSFEDNREEEKGPNKSIRDEDGDAMDVEP